MGKLIQTKIFYKEFPQRTEEISIGSVVKTMFICALKEGRCDAT